MGKKIPQSDFTHSGYLLWYAPKRISIHLSFIFLFFFLIASNGVQKCYIWYYSIGYHQRHLVHAPDPCFSQVGKKIKNPEFSKVYILANYHVQNGKMKFQLNGSRGVLGYGKKDSAIRFDLRHILVVVCACQNAFLDI